MFLMPLRFLGNIPTYRLKPVRRLDNEAQRDIAIKTSAATALAKAAYRKVCFPVTIPNIKNDTSFLLTETGCELRNVPIEKLSR